jgi:hypothetical protein
MALESPGGRVEGKKFHDKNADGVADSDDPGLGDWEIHLDGTDAAGNDVNKVAWTDADSGVYSFTVPLGTYSVTEVCLDPDWYQSQPPPVDDVCGSGFHTVTLEIGDPLVEEIDFGNYKKAVKSGYKFHDLNYNGQWDQELKEPPIVEWEIRLDGIDNDVHEVAWTDNNGYYSFTVPPGSYRVSEVCPEREDWHQSTPAPTDDVCGTGVYSFTLESGRDHAGNNFGNYHYAAKSGHKFEDLNGNAEWELPDELGLESWPIQLDGTDGMNNPVHQDTKTDASGYYSFTMPPGTYTVTEVCEPGWQQTLPKPTDGCGTGVYTGTLGSGATHTDNDFGNLPADQYPIYLPLILKDYG